MRRFRIRGQEGFSLIELMVSMVLSLIVLGAVYSVYRVQAHTVKVQENRQEAQEYARAALDMMVREIRNAGNNPRQATSGANCAGTPTAGVPNILTATSTSINFTYDYRSSGSTTTPDGDCDDADEEITYAYQTPGPQNCTAGIGDIVRTANGTTQPITNCNVTAFSLAYYAIDSSTAMSSIVIANIQRIKVTLTVQSKNPDAVFGGQLVSTVYSNIDLRNRGL